MESSQVWTFFYGSYINFAVLKEVDLVPDRYEVDRLGGFDIRIQPLANVVSSDQHCVYGIVATATHDELARLYRHAADVLSGVYLPEAVLTETTKGKLRPALCYVAPSMEPQPATNEYLDRIVGPAKKDRFLAWYIERLESFRPTAPTSGQR